jgi:putative tricarboxylic transport membrane protein
MSAIHEPHADPEEAGVMRKRTWARLVPIAAALALAATGCGESGGGGGGGSGGTVTGLEILVGTAPGGGFDQTARTAAQVMEDAKLARNVRVLNVPGAGNTVALAQLVNQEGNGKVMQQMGLSVVGNVYTNKSKATLNDVTPIARLTQEPEIVVVRKDSPYQTLQDLTTAWKADPGKVTVGGGGSPGSQDYLTPMLMAEQLGMDPKQVNYVAYDGGGELLTNLLGGEVAFGVTGVGETLDQIEAGEIRALGVSSAERVESVDAPTLKEGGVDLEFINWRGWIAPGGLDEDEKTALTELATKMHDTQQWKDALAKNGWTDAFMGPDEFATFIKEEDTRIREVLSQLGLAA